MKILFICSGLEPGRDGVGDYSRRLACELIGQDDISSGLVSLSDNYISDIFNGTQQSGGIDIPVLRLPAKLPAKERLRVAKKYIDEFNPDWVSLQFVIFGFHPKGLPFGIAKQLTFLGKNRRWQIMFHELWVQIHVEFTFKNYFWGKIQRQIIKSLILTLKPAVIHTNTFLYRYQLTKLGFKSLYLPLFSNIPNIYNQNGHINKQQAIKSGGYLNLVLFGLIHPNAPITDLAREAAAYATKNAIEIKLTIIGRCGMELERWVKAWKSAGMVVDVLGEQSEAHVSQLLQASSIGIATTPVGQIGKSGSVAAMQEHGLPVICVCSPWQGKVLANTRLPLGVTVYQKGNLASIFSSKLPFPEINNVSMVASQFINELLTSSR